MKKVIRLKPSVVESCLDSAAEIEFDEIIIIGVKEGQIHFASTDQPIDTMLGRLDLCKADLIVWWQATLPEEEVD